MKEKFNVLHVLPPQVKALFYLSIFVGLSSFVADYIFSQIFVLFFVKVGFTDASQLNSKLQFLIEDSNLFWTSIIVGVLFAAFCKVGFQIINTLFAEVFQFEAKSFLIKETLKDEGETLNLGEVNFFLSSLIPKSSQFVSLVGKTIVYIIQAGGLFCVCLYLAPKLFLIIIGSLLLASPLYIWAGRKQKILGIYLKNLNEQTSKKLMSSIRNFIFIKIIGHEKEVERNLLKLNDANIFSLKKLSVLNSFLSQFPGVVGILLMFILFYNFSTQNYSKALLISLFYMLYRLIQNLFQVLYCLSNFNVNWPNFLIYRDFVQQAQHTNHKAIQDPNLKQVDSFDLEISDLRFKYANAETELFNGLNCKLNNGDFLLLKGSSGSGKSTILMLVTGILKTFDGIIRWGGIQLKDIDLPNFKKSIGYVGPEPFLFAGTIRENLLYSCNEEIPESEIHQALELADAKDFVFSRSQGLDLAISENGEGLSMGQKQRISLARALIRKPKILVLDEFTANLDSNTEKNILSTIQKLKGKATIVMASHSNRFDEVCDTLIEL